MMYPRPDVAVPVRATRTAALVSANFSQPVTISKMVRRWDSTSSGTVDSTHHRAVAFALPGPYGTWQFGCAGSPRRCRPRSRRARAARPRPRFPFGGARGAEIGTGSGRPLWLPRGPHRATFLPSTARVAEQTSRCRDDAEFAKRDGHVPVHRHRGEHPPLGAGL